MKKTITICVLSFLFTLSLFAQNEFGTTGSHYLYGFEAHDGGGGGWDIISIEGDTMINGEMHKIIKHTYEHTRYTPPSIEQRISYHTMLIDGDSVYVNGNLLMDLDMELEDSLYIPEADFFLDLQLSIDSITTEEIAGYEYKKWHGWKLCPSGFPENDPYEEFTFLETVGQIGYLDFFFWNTDGCIIGGGARNFSCYKNGDFTYPPGVECELPMLTSNEELFVQQQIDVFPNPANDLLNIISGNSEIDKIVIFDLTGKVLWSKKVSTFQTEIELDFLAKGMYMLEVGMGDGKHIHKFVKQ